MDEVLALVSPDTSLAAPVRGAPGYLRPEVVYAATSEGALHLDDVLTRRASASIETADRGWSAAPEAARLMVGPLGWSDDRARREVAAYLDRVRAERRSQEQPDDESAELVRLAARDIVSAAASTGATSDMG